MATPSCSSSSTQTTESLSPGGFALTLWASPSQLFELKRSTLDGQACTLLLEEGEGVSGYTLWGDLQGDSNFTPLSEPFASEGPGLHRYQILVPASLEEGDPLFKLVGRSNAGGEVALEFTPLQESSGPHPPP